MVVLVQTIGDAAEAAQVLQLANDVGLDGVACALQFGRRGTVLADLVELGVDRLFQLFGRDAGLGSRLDIEHGAEQFAVVVDFNVLRDLLFIDKLLVETA